MRQTLVSIKSPIWNGGRPHIGVAEWKVQGVDRVNVKIEYQRKDGSYSFPGMYYMDAEKLVKYPIKIVGSGVNLYVAPLGDWDVEYRCPICGSCPMTVDCNNANCDKGQSNG